ncbi:EexN family lipoprotein [Xanthomonas euvesicatoria]|uniref:EexN family lipoprotein n=1 Tax=Xanthomonas euvesicatoria TaxID=456327 RepID=UPI001C48550F|nr:EexN family lipoprotein [Xanthomonas euvesicatoria]MBV6848798.1 EexN family lipoprotein [Xanthomonas campestris pv. heliotropii]
MRYVLALSVSLLVALLAACSEQPATKLADALAADPVRLKALRARCAADRQGTGEDACRAAAEAFRQRFFSGEAGPDEYQTLADLPPIPPSFDEPADGAAPAPPIEPEGTP